RLNQVARLETKYPFGSFGRCARKTILVHATHLARAPAGCLDEQWLMRWIKLNCCARFTHTRRVNPVGFRIVLIDAVELGTPTCPHFNGQASDPSRRCLEHIVDSPADTVDRRRVFKRLLCL